MTISLSPAPVGGDFINLFTQPALWPNARNRLDAIHVYYDNFLTPAQGGQTAPGYALQDLLDAQAFSNMITWGLDWEIEIWPLVLSYPAHPVLPNQIQVSLDALGNVAAAGGTIKSLRMEWGLDYGLTGQGGYTNGATYSLNQMADDFATLVDAVHAQYPAVLFGDQEPLMTNVPWYPQGFWGPDLWDDWLTALAARGVQLAFMDADTFDWPPGQYPDFAADMAAAKAVCESHGVVFGAEVGPEAYPHTNDQEYYTGTMALVNSVKAAIPTVQRVLFRSWSVPGIPLNVPETAAYSHTRLINDALIVLTNELTPPVASFDPPVQTPATLTMQFTDTSA